MRSINKSWQALLICVLLSGATLAVFNSALHFSFINYDDLDYVVENQEVLKGLSWEGFHWAFTTDHAANWHPLTWLSHMLDCQLYGLNAGGHHLTNLLFHVLNSVLLFLLLRSMTRSQWRSAFVAALFALHPLHVESVAWVSERKDVLSTCFFLVTILAYTRYAKAIDKSGLEAPTLPRHHPVLWYAIALLCFALGLMSKPMLVTLPCVLLLLDYWPLQRLSFSLRSDAENPIPRRLLEKLPFFALSAVASVVTFEVQQAGQSVTTAENLPLEARLANAAMAYWSYLAKTVCPNRLAIFYPHPAMQASGGSGYPFEQIALATLLLAAISLCVWLRRAKAPWLLVGWTWYLGTLVPVIGLVQVGEQSMADRYTYIPLIGVFVATVWGITDALVLKNGNRLLLASSGLALLAACGLCTHKQLAYWKDDQALFGRALEVTARNEPAHYNLGTVLAKNGRYEQALTHLQTATALAPHHADAHYNLAMTLAALNRLDEAIPEYQTALRITPNSAASHINLGVAYWRLGKMNLAQEQYEEALRIEPDRPDAHYNLGLCLSAQGQAAEATRHFDAASRLKPDYFEAIFALAQARLREGSLSDAEAHFQKALRLRPNDPTTHHDLGKLLAIQGKYTEAIPHFRACANLSTNSAKALADLGNVLRLAGQTNEAAGYFASATRLEPHLAEQYWKSGEALAAKGELEAANAQLTTAMFLNPGRPEIRDALGLILAQQGRLDEAVPQFQESLRLSPSAQTYHHLGLARLVQGNPQEAMGNYRKAVSLKPEWPEAMNDLAWVLATTAEANLRNGAEAVAIAKHACELNPGEARFWGTLDAAYAEAGRFAEALATAQKAQEMALAAKEQAIANAAEQRIVLYKMGKAYHQ